MSETKARPHALAFIFILMLMDTIGMGIVIPVVPQLLTELTNLPVSEAILYGGWLMFVYALMHFFFAPVIGNLADRFGRRPVLLLALGVLSIDYMIMATAPTLVWLFIGRILSGIAGATISAAHAYISDVTTPETRAKGFGLIGAAFGLGFIIGPAVGGLLGEIGTRAPFYAAAALAFINMLYGLFVLKETLPPEKRRPFVLWRANPVGALISMRRYPMVIGLFATMFFFNIAHDVYPSTWTFFLIEKFDWSIGQIGGALAVVGVTTAIVAGVLTGPIVKRFGEINAFYLGLGLSIIGFLAYAFVPQGWMLFPAIVVASFMGLIQPSMRSMASRSVPETEQGELQGGFSSIFGLTSIIAPLLLTRTFHHFSAGGTETYFPGAAFLLGSVLLGVAMLMFSRATRRAPIENTA